jgi:hypothetical protein
MRVMIRAYVVGLQCRQIFLLFLLVSDLTIVQVTMLKSRMEKTKEDRR